MDRTLLPPLIRSLPVFEGPFDAFRPGAEGCEVLFATYPAGTTIDPHEHPTNNVGVITAGELVLTVDGEEQRYGAGDWYHVPPGTQHGARFEQNTAEIEFWFTHDGSDD